MFQQAPPIVCWSTYANPKTMVFVGTEVVALLCQDIVIFEDLKTRAITNFKSDRLDGPTSISLLAGHNRFPLFAVAEAILLPKIFVFKYPDMERLMTLPSEDITMYLTLNLSEHGYLTALSDAPNYTIRMWNYRTGTHYADVHTYKKCLRNSIFFTTVAEPILIQYSQWHKEILVYELCQTGEKYDILEIMTLELSGNYDKSQLFPIAFSEDGTAYIVDDYGNVAVISMDRFALENVWSPSIKDAEPEAHMLFSNKTGIFVVNSKRVYAIRKRQNDCVVEWMVDDVQVSIKKMLVDYNGNIYAATGFGNIYTIEQNKDAWMMKGFSTNCYKILDYCILKSVKDEVILFLTASGDLRLVDLIRMNRYSNLNIENACIIGSHNTLPNIAVGTTNGRIHFVSYEKIRLPAVLGVIDLETAMISHIELYDNTTFLKDKTNSMHIILSDFKNKTFKTLLSLQPEKKGYWHLLKLSLVDGQRALAFITPDTEIHSWYASELWSYTWNMNASELRVHCKEFDLPFKYRDFAIIQGYTVDSVEFVGIRYAELIIDILVLTRNAKITLIHCLSTCHLGQLHAINGTKNIITGGTQGVIYHFRSHKKSKVTYKICRQLMRILVPRLRRKMDECFNSKYFVVLYGHGEMLCYRLPLLVDNLKENTPLAVNFDPIMPRIEKLKPIQRSEVVVVREVNDRDYELQQSIKDELKSLRNSVRDLINYDISVTGKSHGIYKKFCLNKQWLQMLTEEAKILCENERELALKSIAEQSRIRDWIFALIRNKKTFFSFKLRSIFSSILMENYSTNTGDQSRSNAFDFFRFYDVDLNEDEDDVRSLKSRITFEDVSEESIKRKPLKHFEFGKDMSVYDHVMSKDFEMQDVNLVSFNQMYNEDAKLEFLLIGALKEEFNREFAAVKQYKDEIMSIVLDSNSNLKKIYSNMNCMLCLLNMEKFVPPELTVPRWEKDENIDKILTVDDSEITAINRRKKILEAAARHSGRMLLWPLEYWVKALITMMDGVLEKLWEEEIKKTPPPPEFVHRKNIHEYSIEDQKNLVEYEKKLRLLEEDRRKYLRILKDSEAKAINYKKRMILRFNERLAEAAILKLKYDFAINHERLRLLNFKITNFKRIECRRRINTYREEIDKIGAYIGKFTKLLDFWERTFAEVKAKLDTQTYRDKQLERQFKGQYLNSVPAHLTHELNKIYKRRPKLPAKAFSTANVCFEVADRITSKKQHKFPLPQELMEFLSLIDGLDEQQNCPNQLDSRYWDSFIKLRRQKLESEMRLKGIGYQLLDSQNLMNFFSKDLVTLKNKKAETGSILMETMEEYFDVTQNQKLELVLTMGQVEIKVRKSTSSFKNCVLMNVDDINSINEMIKQAGLKKLNAMHRVAYFRRQVIYKEWEHKVERANIAYLQYILKLIENCKVTYEFLEALRNWEKVRENKASSSRLGLIEQMIEERLEAGRRALDSLSKDIDDFKGKVFNMRRANQQLNKQIANLKSDVTYLALNRDELSEQKLARQRKDRFRTLVTHSNLVETVRKDFVQIMELKTILELQRLRTYPTLGPAQPQCNFED